MSLRVNETQPFALVSCRVEQISVNTGHAELGMCFLLGTKHPLCPMFHLRGSGAQTHRSHQLFNYENRSWQGTGQMLMGL